jgi:glycosyltransferase involved in cell wall biosynthesis
MNICQVILSQRGWGGAETVVYELTRYLRDKGHDVTVITNQEQINNYAGLENVALFDIGPLYDPIALIKSIVSPRTRAARVSLYSPRNRALFLFNAYSSELLARVYHRRIRSRVRRFLSDRNVDVVHSHMSDSALFVHTLGDLWIPTVTTPHGEHYLGASVPIHPLMRPLAGWKTKEFKQSLDGTSMVTEVSDAMLRDYERRGIHLTGRTAVIPNGVSLGEFQGSSTSALKLKGEFNLLFPGGSKFVKGGDLAVKAMATVKGRIPGVHLYIALDVPKNHLLRKMVSQHALEEYVTFSGFLPPQEYRRLLYSVDVLLMPSRGEAFAIACLEAMAFGKPIVATKAGGIPEVVIEGRNGLLVNGDPDEIAEAILHLHRNRELRREMGLNNMHDVVVFDWSLIADRYLRVYKEVCGGKD